MSNPSGLADRKFHEPRIRKKHDEGKVGRKMREDLGADKLMQNLRHLCPFQHTVRENPARLGIGQTKPR